MNPELPDLKQLSAEALRDLLNNLTQAKAFAIEQAPEFCQQLIARGLVSAISEVIFCAFGLMVIAAVAFLLWRNYEKLDGVAVWVLGGIFGGFATIACFIGLGAGATKAVIIYVAPKVFLVEEITRMIK